MTILEVETREGDGRIEIALRGELDLSTAPKVQDALDRAEAGRPPVLVLDLSQLSFLDSTGLRCVVAAARRADEQDRRLVVVRGPEAVQRVFTITGLEERLHMVDDASAIAPGD